MTEKKQRDLQTIFVQLETYRKQVESINKQLQLLDSAVMESRSTTASLDSLKKNKVGAELFVNIGSNSFIRATLKDNKKVLIGVGGDVSLEKPISEAKEILGQRAAEFTKAMEKMQKSSMELNAVIAELNKKAEQLVQELKT